DGDTVAQDGVGDRGDVFTAGVVLAVDDGVGLGGGDHGEAGAGTGADAQPFLRRFEGVVFTGARGAHEALRVVVNMIGHGHQFNDLLKGDDLFGVDDDLGLFTLGRSALHDLQLLLVGRITDADEEHKAVELRFGQR